MRPLYESRRDLQNEIAVINQIAPLAGCGYRKLTQHERADFALVRGESVCGFVEIKCRNCEHDTYPTFHISNEKMKHLQKLSQTVPTFLVIKWTDGIRFTQITEMPYRLTMGGRWDRNDPYDFEQMAHVPIGEFQPVSSFKRLGV